MSTSENCRVHRLSALVLGVVALCVLAPVDAGEIKLSKYIEPNQMSNLLTRHVRKGVIQDVRPVLTEPQLEEVREMFDEVREASKVHFADFAESLAAGELLGKDTSSNSRR